MSMVDTGTRCILCKEKTFAIAAIKLHGGSYLQQLTHPKEEDYANVLQNCLGYAQ